MKQVEQIEMKMISAELVTVRTLPEVKISFKDEVKVFNSPSSILDALKYLMQVYGLEDDSLRQLSVKMSKNKEDIMSIAVNSISN